MANEPTTEASNPSSQATPCGSYPATVCSASSSPDPRQLVECVWCGWIGLSPVRKILKLRGVDFPIECRKCHAIGLQPFIEQNPTENCTGRLADGTVPPVVGISELK